MNVLIISSAQYSVTACLYVQADKSGHLYQVGSYLFAQLLITYSIFFRSEVSQKQIQIRHASLARTAGPRLIIV